MRFCSDCKHKYTMSQSPCTECRRFDKMESGNPAVALLEKLKAELKGESDFTGAGHLVVEWETIEKVIDNRISELKGEDYGLH